MPASAPQKNNLLGGIVLCAFPLIVFFVTRLEGVRIPADFAVLFGLFLLSGIWTVFSSLVKVDPAGTASLLAKAVFAFGFALFAFLVAWQEKAGWIGSIPFLPDSWNQVVPRIAFGATGVLVTILGISSLRRALQVRGGNRGAECDRN